VNEPTVPTTDLLGGIVADTRELLGAHADRVHREVLADLRTVGTAARATVIATAAGMVTAVVLGGAVVATLVALGLALWAAAWIVFALFGITAAALAARARAASIDHHVVDELRAARDDVAWAGTSAVKALEGEPASAAPPTHPLH
jgi:hypothetical protein